MLALCRAQTISLPEDFIHLDADDVGGSAIAFVNINSAPGIASASLDVDGPNRDSSLTRNNLGFGAEFTLRDRIIDGYWGAALIHGDLDDTLTFINSTDDVLQFQVEREILTLQGSIGAAVPITRRFKLRPYFTLSLSEFDTQTTFTGLMGGAEVLPDEFTAAFLASSTEALTGATTLEAIYDRSTSKNRLELSGQYTASYTDSFNATNKLLDTFGWTQTALLRTRLSGKTRWRPDTRQVWWNTYVNHTRFINEKKFSLGFTYFTEVGIGIDYEWNIRPLDWFGLRFVGLKVGGIFGDDITGYSIGLNFR